MDGYEQSSSQMSLGVPANGQQRPRPPSGVWSQRDAVFEDEVMIKGLYADTVFKCAASSPPNDLPGEVFGQAALFALMSPVLRERLDLSRDGARGSSLQEMALDSMITTRAFQEVARYVYRLPHRFTMAKCAEVTVAARILDLPELDEGLLQWAHGELEELRLQNSQHEVICDAIAFLGALSLPIGGASMGMQTRRGAALAWRATMMQAFTAPEIASSPAFLQLPEEAMLLLLESGDIHRDSPEHLWTCCVQWAKLRREREVPPLPPSFSGPNYENPPKKLFAAGARVVTVSAPKPALDEVGWQTWLLPIAERTDFNHMSPQSFAAYMEAINPMLPELRQVIYKVRRSGFQSDPT